MTVSIFLVEILFCIYISQCDSAKILGVSWYPAISHQAFFQPIWKALSLKGHQVTVITSGPMRDKTLLNLTEIDVSFLFEKLKASHQVENITSRKWIWNSVIFIKKLLMTLVEAMWNHQEVSKLMKSDQHFDIVIVEPHIQLIFVLGEIFNAPVIGK